MQIVKTFSVLALATGAVVAMPAHVEGQLAKRQFWGGNRFWQRPNPTAEITVTGYAPEPTGAWTTEASTTSTTTVATTTSTTTTVEVVVTATPAADFNYGGRYNRPTPEESTPTAAPAAPETPSAAPAPSSAPAPSTGSSQDGYMSVVSKWRAAGGLPALSQDSTLEANALKTSTDSVGGLIHELNPGTMAQVLAPGTPSNFESVYVGGWLCEIPSLPGLDGICSTEAQGWDHSNGETGHAEILTSTSYSKIGCALSSSTGVWACDLA
ncbi:uncharacterized protein Z519_07210 [Cladophialophora bantiana CBS 173.52]|uniref:SCP domain-containing protein n=1 Tax=Cladophialophora bantiana (strain ATCC 10958 / CBS 173.52 / CDC B-1940 / NIH 8579) TaxID=1442370 RepID=A0A0D2EQJ2_CLAB1|nr:uncharacterized protein Z519_07210 [Cladophialophora bantiana CBS 173.52]KIW92226.1 hypothetical protein Z519_07210 [Cladophialophora bantiana CBS 173.52]